MQLTNEEYNVVEKISRNSKCDCWFELGVDENFNDIVVDLEEDTTMSLEDGLLLLDSCLTDLTDYNLTEEEQCCYKSLIKKMQVLQTLTHERLVILLQNALTILEEANLACQCLKISKLQAEIGITDEEYDYIMSETPNEDDDYFVEENTENTPAERRKIDDENPDAH